MILFGKPVSTFPDHALAKKNFAKLPPQETNQPNPILQLSVGRLGFGAIALVAVAAAIIVGVVPYGPNSPVPNAQDVGAPRSAPAGAGSHRATGPRSEPPDKRQ